MSDWHVQSKYRDQQRLCMFVVSGGNKQQRGLWRLLRARLLQRGYRRYDAIPNYTSRHGVQTVPRGNIWQHGWLIVARLLGPVRRPARLSLPGKLFVADGRAVSGWLLLPRRERNERTVLSGDSVQRGGARRAAAVLLASEEARWRRICWLNRRNF